MIDFGFYFFYILFAISVQLKMKVSNFKIVQKIEVALSFPTFILGNWGFSLLYSEGISDWRKG